MRGRKRQRKTREALQRALCVGFIWEPDAAVQVEIHKVILAFYRPGLFGRLKALKRLINERRPQRSSWDKGTGAAVIGRGQVGLQQHEIPAQEIDPLPMTAPTAAVFFLGPYGGEQR